VSRHPSLPCGFSALGLAVLSLTTACVHVSPGPQKQRLTDARQVLHMVLSTQELVQTAQGSADLAVRSTEGKGSMPLLVSAAHPGAVHIEQLNFFGAVESTLVCDADSFGLARQGVYYAGPPTQDNLARFIPLPLTPSELASVLLGRVPTLQDAQAALQPSDEGPYRIELRSPNETQALTVDPSTFRILKSQVQGLRGYTLELSDFEDRDQAFFPRRMVLTDTAKGDQFNLHYGADLILNSQMDPQAFVPRPPAGAKVVNLNP
jgi:hypothetical protein